MRRFRFPLAAFEKLLAHREDEARLRATEAAARRQRAADLVDHLERLADAARGERGRRRADGSLEPHEELLYGAYLERMAYAIDGRRRDLEKAADEHEARRRQVRDAATRRKIVGLLRERRLAEHRRAALRDLTRVLDEAGARQFHYGSTDGPEGPSPAA